MPPQVNARLTAVTGAGTADDWDRPGTAGAAKFAGSLPAYYREKVDRRAGAGGLEVDVIRTLWLDTAGLDSTGLDTNDTVTFTARGQTVTARVITIARSELAGVPASLQTTRVDLELA